MRSKKQILLIDPNLFHFEVLKKALSQSSSHHFFLTRVSHPTEAPAILKSHRFDLIVTDHFFQNTNEWFPPLLEAAPHVPILVLTSQKDEKKAVEMMKLGATDYLVKSQELLKDLPLRFLKISEKRKVKKERKTSPGTFQILAKNIRSLADVINQSSLDFMRNPGKFKQIVLLEREVERMKQVLKNLVS